MSMGDEVYVKSMTGSDALLHISPAAAVVLQKFWSAAAIMIRFIGPEDDALLHELLETKFKEVSDSFEVYLLTQANTLIPDFKEPKVDILRKLVALFQEKLNVEVLDETSMVLLQAQRKLRNRMTHAGELPPAVRPLPGGARGLGFDWLPALQPQQLTLRNFPALSAGKGVLRSSTYVENVFKLHRTA